MEYKHKTVSMMVTASADELDKPQRLRGSVPRSLLEGAGLVRPRYGMTMREQMAAMQDMQAATAARMRKAQGAHLFGWQDK